MNATTAQIAKTVGKKLLPILALAAICFLVLGNTAYAEEDLSTQSDTTVPVYRLYNDVTSEHLYTTDIEEAQNLSGQYDRLNWKYEGTGWYSPASGTPIYRLYNPILGHHLYTSNQSEISSLVASWGWQNEGVLFYSGGSVSIYRVYNPFLHGLHLWTTSQQEYNSLPSHQWQQENVAFQAVSLGDSGAPLSKYSYEVYNVGPSTNIYSGCTNSLFIKTDNPNPGRIKLTVDGKSTGRTTSVPYDDVVPLDNYVVQDGLKRVEGGYFVSYVFPEGGNHIFGISEYNSNYTASWGVSTWNINVLDYDAIRAKWWQDIIDKYTTPSMTKTQKMSAVCNYLCSNAAGFRYSTVSNGKVVYLAAKSGVYFETKRWNSYSSPSALYTLAQIIGFDDDDIHNCYGDYPVGSPDWQNTHYYCRVRENGVWSGFAVCPSFESGEIGDFSPIDFNNTAAFTHWTKNN